MQRGVIVAAVSLMFSCHLSATKSQVVPSFDCPPEGLVAPCICGISGSPLKSDQDHGGIVCPSSITNDDLDRILSLPLPPRPKEHFFLLGVDSQEPCESQLDLIYGDAFAAHRFDHVEFHCVNSISAGFMEALGATSIVTLMITRVRGEFHLDVPLHGLRGLLYVVDVPYLTSLGRLDAPNLKTLTIANCENLSELEADVFEVAQGLVGFSLDGNAFATLKAGTFTFPFPDDPLNETPKVVSLFNNRISSIELGAFQDRAYYLYLEGNLLTALDRDVFEPLFQAGTLLYIQNNPLDCTCDAFGWVLEEYVGHIFDSVWAQICGVSISDVTPEMLGCELAENVHGIV